jgi:MtfA peptidase
MLGAGGRAQRRERAARAARRAHPRRPVEAHAGALPLPAPRDPADAAELRRLTSLFLDRKEFTRRRPAADQRMAVAIAAQACLPVLRLGLAALRRLRRHRRAPRQVVARREHADDDGVVHEYDEVLAGEAMEGGPVMLSWRDVRAAGRSARRATTSSSTSSRTCWTWPTAWPTACRCCRPACRRRA